MMTGVMLVRPAAHFPCDPLQIELHGLDFRHASVPLAVDEWLRGAYLQHHDHLLDPFVYPNLPRILHKCRLVRRKNKCVHLGRARFLLTVLPRVLPETIEAV